MYWRNRNANVQSHIVEIRKKMSKSCVLHPWWINSTTLALVLSVTSSQSNSVFHCKAYHLNSSKSAQRCSDRRSDRQRQQAPVPDSWRQLAYPVQLLPRKIAQVQLDIIQTCACEFMDVIYNVSVFTRDVHCSSIYC